MAMVMAPGAGELCVEQVVILPEQAGFLVGQREHGIVLQKEVHVPVIPRHHRQPLGIGAGQHDTARLDIGRKVHVLDNRVGHTDEQVVAPDGIRFTVDFQGARALRAERQDNRPQPHGMFGIKLLRCLGQRQHAVVVTDGCADLGVRNVSGSEVFCHGWNY